MSNEYSGQKPYHIDGAATSVVKSGRGVLHSLVVNTTGAAGNFITLYDNTAASGSIIAILPSNGAQRFREYNVEFGIGLTVVTTTTGDWTINYS